MPQPFRHLLRPARALLTGMLLAAPFAAGCQTLTAPVVRSQDPGVAAPSHPDSILPAPVTEGGISAGVLDSANAEPIPAPEVTAQPSGPVPAPAYHGGYDAACQEGTCEPRYNNYHCPHPGCPHCAHGLGHKLLHPREEARMAQEAYWGGAPHRKTGPGLNFHREPVGDWYPTHYHSFTQHRGPGHHHQSWVYPQNNAPAGVWQYPYYPVRGPSDFFME